MYKIINNAVWTTVKTGAAAVRNVSGGGMVRSITDKFRRWAYWIF